MAPAAGTMAREPGEQEDAHAETRPHVSGSRDIRIQVQHPGHPLACSVNGPVGHGAAYVAIPRRATYFRSRALSALPRAVRRFRGPGLRGLLRPFGRPVSGCAAVSPAPPVSGVRRPARPPARAASGPGPDQSFLHYRHHELTVAGEHLPASQAQGAAGIGDSCEYSSHRSARNGRWNHIAWSRLAPVVCPSAQDSPCASRTESSSVMSDAYVIRQTCSNGSSGSSPSARSQTRLVGLRSRGIGHRLECERPDVPDVDGIAVKEVRNVRPEQLLHAHRGRGD